MAHLCVAFSVMHHVLAMSIVDLVEMPSCRRLLREEFRSGRLAAAPSKAAALQALCEKLKFDADEAASINRDLFTERIETFLEDEKLTGAQICYICCTKGRGPPAVQYR